MLQRLCNNPAARVSNSTDPYSADSCQSGKESLESTLLDLCNDQGSSTDNHPE